MQGELFGTPGGAAASSHPTVQKLAFLERTRISLGLDQVVIGLIALLVIYVLIFSFGVEKGKRLGFAELEAERSKKEAMMRELQEKIFTAPVAVTVPPSALLEAKGIARAPGKPAKGEREPYPAGKYTIQLVTYKTQSAAGREIRRLSEKGRKGFVIPSGSYLQVCMDGFESREQAGQVLEELKSQRIAPSDAFVRLIPQGA